MYATVVLYIIVYIIQVLEKFKKCDAADAMSFALSCPCLVVIICYFAALSLRENYAYTLVAAQY